jgi:hypothetical protein
MFGALSDFQKRQLQFAQSRPRSGLGVTATGRPEPRIPGSYVNTAIDKDSPVDPAVEHQLAQYRGSWGIHPARDRKLAAGAEAAFNIGKEYQRQVQGPSDIGDMNLEFAQRAALQQQTHQENSSWLTPRKGTQDGK